MDQRNGRGKKMNKIKFTDKEGSFFFFLACATHAAGMWKKRLTLREGVKAL